MKYLAIIFSLLVGIWTVGFPISYLRDFETLEFISDSTFLYKKSADRLLSYSEGSYLRISKNKLVLKTYDELVFARTQFFQERVGDINKITLNIDPILESGLNGDNINYCVIIDNKRYPLKGRTLTIPFKALNQIQLKAFVNVVRLPWFTYTRDTVASNIEHIKSEDGNLIRIKFYIKKKHFITDLIVNDTLIVDGSQIIWKRMGRKPFKRI